MATTNQAIRESMPQEFNLLTAGTYTGQNVVAVFALVDTVLGAGNVVNGATKDLSTVTIPKGAMI